MSDDAGAVIWPIPEDGISYLDALWTVFDISQAVICLSAYAENGDDLNGDLALVLIGMARYHGSPPSYFYKPLKQALEEELDDFSDFDILAEAHSLDQWPKGWPAEKVAAREKSERLIIRLLRAYREWEANEAGWTIAELKARPLPAVSP